MKMKKNNINMNDKMGITMYLSIITLNVNGLNVPIKKAKGKNR